MTSTQTTEHSPMITPLPQIASYGAAGQERIEVASSPCSMPELEDGTVSQQLVDRALKPLWACWRALKAARDKLLSAARADPMRHGDLRAHADGQ